MNAYAKNVAKWGGLFILLVLAASMLAGCASTLKVEAPVTHARSNLPDVPSDVRRCFNVSLGALPDRDLTVEEVEAAWKSDALRIRVVAKCGQRFVAWYDQIRKGWR